ncbi:response regulator [Chitinimonas arctica]|uniref:Response regulator n=2 Tax=Chitinimonas arctica TaxID=2594795 RepID=A0A516SMA5_9NEIS|nr:response regulator [Chitinimonas arctica]
MLAEEGGQAEPPFSLLAVDDESNILASLRRLFRPHGYRILTAGSGKEGLALLETEQIDLVISDMRMPEMDGAQFLTQVRNRWPDTVRILLTGYADISSTVEAINKAQIHRYIAKPWDENELLDTVRQSLELKGLQREKKRLDSLLEQRNNELLVLNTSLEAKVQERTAALEQAMLLVESSHEKLKKSFLTSIRIFANLIELREGKLAGHSRRVTEMSRHLGQIMGLAENAIQDLVVASLLHDIGKLGLPDVLLSKPFATLTSDERLLYVKHPIKGQQALMALDTLEEAALIIRSHHERHDGLGYPDQLNGEQIPLGARILALVNDYDGLLNGTLLPRIFTKEEAVKAIMDGSGRRYHPDVVAAFVEFNTSPPDEETPTEREISSRELSPDMVLARDLISPAGTLLLAKDYQLSQRAIDRIRRYEEVESCALKCHVKTE